MTVDLIEKFKDGHYRINVTFSNGEKKEIGIAPNIIPGLSNDDYLKTELSKLENQDEIPKDITISLKDKVINVEGKVIKT